MSAGDATEARGPAGGGGLDFAGGGERGLLYCQLVEACFAERIGRHGLDRGSFEAALAATAPALEGLRARYRDGFRILRLPEARDDLALIEHHAERLRGDFGDVVILGTGGSSLGGQCLAALAEQGFAPPPGAPRLHFLDNIDPARFAAMFEALDLSATGALAISKSGSTPETITQLLIYLAVLRETLGEGAPARHVTVITEPGDNPLRRIAARFGLPVLDHDPEVGGRYSVLSLVGLLPARVVGVDIVAVRAGAARVVAALIGAKDPACFPPAVGAAIAIALERKGRLAATVIMPYLDRLAPFGLWFRQLWAESLGKEGKGTTPVPALGAVDQHSQLQLYLDGPADKLFTLVVAAQEGRGRPIPAELAGDERLSYLAGRTMGDLLAAEQRATYDTLAAAGRPVRVIALDVLNENALGALLMHYMIEVMIAAELLGVNPFDQPAVEDGKRRARAYLSQRGPAPASEPHGAEPHTGKRGPA